MNVVNAKAKDEFTALKAHGASCSSIKSFHHCCISASALKLIPSPVSSHW